LFARLDQLVRRIISAADSGWGRILQVVQVLDNVFCVDKVEDSAFKFFGSDCEHSPVRGGGYWSGPCWRCGYRGWVVPV